MGRLQTRWNALQASLILGAIWSLWHLPLHFILGTTQAAIPVWQFFLQTTLVSVLYTWLFNNTAGSVLVVTIFHAMSNISSALLPYWVEDSGRWINFVLLAIVTVFVIVKYGARELKERN